MIKDCEPILDLRHVTKVYKTKGSLFGARSEDVVALNDISLTLFRGEIFGLVGESGSGKTTVGRLVVRLEKTDQGQILLDGMDVTGLKGSAVKDFRRKVQMIFQDPYQSLNPQRSVFETVSEPLVVHGIGDAAQRMESSARALKSVGLSPPEGFLYRYPHRLSGGQRQRVAIARAMVLEPEFVIADEPTSMLDASISAQIFNILLSMRENFGVTLLFITHSLAAARYLCDRIGVIYHGNLMEIGPAEDIIQRPKHPYTQALIDALPKFGSMGEVPRYETLLKQEREGNRSTGCAFYPRCQRAILPRCNMERPELRESAPSHWVACFLETGTAGGTA